jgi:hypothetical protein
MLPFVQEHGKAGKSRRWGGYNRCPCTGTRYSLTHVHPRYTITVTLSQAKQVKMLHQPCKDQAVPRPPPTCKGAAIAVHSPLTMVGVQRGGARRCQQNTSVQVLSHTGLLLWHTFPPHLQVSPCQHQQRGCGLRQHAKPNTLLIRSARQQGFQLGLRRLRTGVGFRHTPARVVAMQAPRTRGACNHIHHEAAHGAAQELRPQAWVRPLQQQRQQQGR